mmetsp:Transcript_11680/g.29349  ORF Transcript_11680/g.29349 Transcript_11680/m.29349 type:complete len:318 (-) Transcript_11680:40-993(-)
MAMDPMLVRVERLTEDKRALERRVQELVQELERSNREKEDLQRILTDELAQLNAAKKDESEMDEARREAAQSRSERDEALRQVAEVREQMAGMQKQVAESSSLRAQLDSVKKELRNAQQQVERFRKLQGKLAQENEEDEKGLQLWKERAEGAEAHLTSLQQGLASKIEEAASLRAQQQEVLARSEEAQARLSADLRRWETKAMAVEAELEKARTAQASDAEQIRLLKADVRALEQGEFEKRSKHLVERAVQTRYITEEARLQQQLKVVEEELNELKTTRGTSTALQMLLKCVPLAMLHDEEMAGGIDTSSQSSPLML